MGKTLQWKVSVVELFNEILANAKYDSQIRIPLNIIINYLAQIAQRATELNDPQLNKLMIRLSLYSISDPNDPEFNPELVRKILNE